jgi:hypothetical protein
MNRGAPYLVMRYSPMIGRPESPRRVDVACRCYTLVAALAAAGAGTPNIHRWFWIVKVGAPAHRRSKRVVSTIYEP